MRTRLATATAAAALAGLLVLTGCRNAAAPDNPGEPEVDVLGSMMAGASELNTLMGTTAMGSKTALRTPMKNDTFEPLSRPECIVVSGNGMDWVYGDSGYTQFREVQFADDDADMEVDQVVAEFDSIKAAQALVARTVDIWRRCGGGTLAISFDGGQTTKAQLLGVPTVIDRINVTRVEATDIQGYTSHRAILAVDNMVVDLRVSDHEADDAKVVQLAKVIAARNAL